jgi:hypothetical protein
MVSVGPVDELAMAPSSGRLPGRVEQARGACVAFILPQSGAIGRQNSSMSGCRQNRLRDGAEVLLLPLPLLLPERIAGGMEANHPAAHVEESDLRIPLATYGTGTR